MPACASAKARSKRAKEAGKGASRGPHMHEGTSRALRCPTNQRHSKEPEKGGGKGDSTPPTQRSRGSRINTHKGCVDKVECSVHQLERAPTAGRHPGRPRMAWRPRRARAPPAAAGTRCARATPCPPLDQCMHITDTQRGTATTTAARSQRMQRSGQERAPSRCSARGAVRHAQ